MYGLDDVVKDFSSKSRGVSAQEAGSKLGAFAL
jgi:hypothetical protein